MNSIKAHTKVGEAVLCFAASFFAKVEFSALGVSAVAVVVFAVSTDLGSSRIDGFVVVIAVLETFASRPDTIAVFVIVYAVTRLCGAAIVVDLAVAVVIDVVSADLLGGNDFTLASAPLRKLASLGAHTTSADIFGGRCTAVTGAGFAVVASGGGAATFIDLSIAVIVCIVSADLGGAGQDLICASAPFPERTALGATFAASYAIGVGGPAITGTGYAIIDLSIAIIVDPVASLGTSATCGSTNDLAIFAKLCARATFVCAVSATTRVSFVNFAVAVVVFSIATFLAWFDFAATTAPFAAAASLGAFLADADAFGPAGTCVASASLACATLRGGAPTSATVRITARYPTCYVVVLDLVPSLDVCAGARDIDILAVGFGLEDGKASTFWYRTDGCLVGVGSRADVERRSTKAYGLDVGALGFGLGGVHTKH